MEISLSLINISKSLGSKFPNVLNSALVSITLSTDKMFSTLLS